VRDTIVMQPPSLKSALMIFLTGAITNFAVVAFNQPIVYHGRVSWSVALRATDDDKTHCSNGISRRGAFSKVASATFTTASFAAIFLGGSPSFSPKPASAIGPVKLNLLNPKYSAVACPRDKPIPGNKAMKGMRGLCVTVDADLEENPDLELEKVGVYGFVTDKGTGESVLANNPDGGTDAGQFAMIEKIGTAEKKIQFEFIAAVPKEMDLSGFENGIAPLDFKSLRIISYPGGQQYGAISPCEMNEFSDECAAWEEQNGPYENKEYMVKKNPRTKGR